MLLCCACLLARTRRAHSANKRALARNKDIEGLARRAIVSYFTREEERRSRSTQIMMKLELISCQASSDATAQLWDFKNSTWFIHWPSSCWLAAFSGASSETGGICTGLLAFPLQTRHLAFTLNSLLWFSDTFSSIPLPFFKCLP